MRICVPVDETGDVSGGWGRAPRVAVADVEDAEIRSWQEFAVGWDRLHDEGPEGGHHARIARFLREHDVAAVTAGHMGEPMRNMLERMGIRVVLGAAGEARGAVLDAALPGQPRR